MNDKEIFELMKYSSPYELYIVNKQNRVVKLKCPFKVLVKYSIGALKANTIVFVTQLKITRELKEVFIINNQAYYCHHFIIL